MVELWYALVAIAFTTYVVLDGFDLGAGALHLLLAKNEAERKAVFAAIGPYWDGNEVWLLAGGGTLFLAFPPVLAAAFSGMYLAMFLVVWALILRGLSIELRGHVDGDLWRAFWDFVFCASSAGLAILFGVALGNVLRGFPIVAGGMIVLPLFVDFTPAPPTGLIDWYTVLVGLFALTALCTHAALFLAWRTEGELRERAERFALRLRLPTIVLWVGCFAASLMVARVRFGPAPVACLAMAALGLGAWPFLLRRGQPLHAFLGSCLFLAASLLGIAASVFPVMLRALDVQSSITAFSAAASPHALGVGVAWYGVGLALVVGYFVNLFRVHRRR